MATLKERLNRKNSLGGYDTIYLETSSDLVKRPDGSTVESALVTVNTKVTELNTTVENVTTNVTQQVQTIIQQGNAKHASSHASGGVDPITPASIGALASGGTAAAATKLATARTFRVNLGSTSSASFNGTANVTPGVTGVLGLGNGGTGKTTAPLGLYNLINGCTAISESAVVDTDVIPVGDVSAATAKKLTIADLKNMCSTSLQIITSDIPRQPGSVCNWGGYNWTVVHVTTDLIYMILTNIYSMTTFGSNTRYSQSNLIGLCNTFLNSMDAPYRNALADVTVNGVTQKVFVPAHGMVCNDSPNPYRGSNGTNNYQATSGTYGDGKTAYPVFSWFNNPYNTAASGRVAMYNGSAQPWWTSTAYGSGYVWGVVSDGDADGYGSPGGSTGFRPCVAVKRK